MVGGLVVDAWKGLTTRNVLEEEGICTKDAIFMHGRRGAPKPDLLCQESMVAGLKIKKRAVLAVHTLRTLGRVLLVMAIQRSKLVADHYRVVYHAHASGPIAGPHTRCAIPLFQALEHSMGHHSPSNHGSEWGICALEGGPSIKVGIFLQLCPFSMTCLILHSP